MPDAFHLHVPDRRFAEGVVGPVPAVFLEESDAVAQILVSPRRPGGGTELARVYLRPVLELELAAAFELGYRRLRVRPKDLKSMRVTTADEAYGVFKFIAQDGDLLENFWVLPLDARRHPLSEPIRVARGQANTSYVMPRDVFREAIKWDAHCVMVAHNHPGGDPTPSESDMETTRQLMAMSKDLGIPLLDHLVISNSGYTSIRHFTKGQRIDPEIDRS